MARLTTEQWQQAKADEIDDCFANALIGFSEGDKAEAEKHLEAFFNKMWDRQHHIRLLDMAGVDYDKEKVIQPESERFVRVNLLSAVGA